jgi:hypothetical protein
MIHFRPSRLCLGQCLEELAAAGAPAAATLLDMIRDGRLADDEARNGPRLYLADDCLSGPWTAAMIGGTWGWAWLRVSPDIDIATSTIRAPDLTPAPRPALSMTWETFRMMERPAASPPRWTRVRIEIGAESFDRLLSPVEGPLQIAPAQEAVEADPRGVAIIAALRDRGNPPEEISWDKFWEAVIEAGGKDPKNPPRGWGSKSIERRTRKILENRPTRQHKDV